MSDNIRSDLERADELMGRAQYAAALPLLQATLRRSEQLRPDGAASRVTAVILCKLGHCSLQLFDLRAAAAFFRRAATIEQFVRF